MYHAIFLDDENTVVIKTQSLTLWNFHSSAIRREFKHAAVLSFLAKSLKPKVQFFISSYHHCNYVCSQCTCLFF